MTCFSSRSLLLAAGLAVAATAGQAGTVSQQYSGGIYSVFGGPDTSDRKFRDVTTTDDVDGTNNTAAGAFYLVDEDNILGNGPGANFVAFCVDIFNTLGLPSEYEKTGTPFTGTGQPGTLDAGQKNRVQELFDNNYAGLDFDDSDEVAGFQAALWEVLFEGDDNYDVKAGDFQVSWGLTDGAKVAANAFLGMGDDGQTNYNLTWLQSEGGGQNLVTVAPVPLPAGGVLLLGALGGLAVARRRRKA